MPSKVITSSIALRVFYTVLLENVRLISVGNTKLGKKIMRERNREKLLTPGKKMKKLYKKGN